MVTSALVSAPLNHRYISSLSGAEGNADYDTIALGKENCHKG